MNKFTINAFADESSPEIDGQIDALKRNNLNGVELRGVDGQNVCDITVEKAKEVKEKMDRNGFKIWSIGSRLGKIKITDDFAPHAEEFKRTLETARITEARYIRLFSFYIPTGEDYEIYFDEVLERMNKFLEMAKGSGVLLCHENEKGIYGDIAPRCRKLFDNLPGLGGIFDPANFIQCGQDTLEAWNLLEKNITYMHIKDALSDGSIVPAGNGKGHVAELLKRFAANGGTGLTVEPHLSVFKGLSGLERAGETSVVGKYQYPSMPAAFDAAIAALRKII